MSDTLQRAQPPNAATSCWRHLLAYNQDLSTAQQGRFGVAIEKLKAALLAREKDRIDTYSPSLDQFFITAIKEFVPEILDLRAEVSWGKFQPRGEAERFSAQLETDRAGILDGVRACVHGKDLHLLNKSSIRDATQTKVSSWIRKAELQFPVPPEVPQPASQPEKSAPSETIGPSLEPSAALPAGPSAAVQSPLSIQPGKPCPKRGPAADELGHVRVAQLLSDDWGNDLPGALKKLAAPQDGGTPVEPSPEWKRKYNITSYADLVTYKGTVDVIGEKEIKQHIARRMKLGIKVLEETLGNSRKLS